jgi:SAM (Sterile alpha motif) domain-containing protein
MDVAAWLRALGLDQYEAAFRANGVDTKVLPTLTGEELNLREVIRSYQARSQVHVKNTHHPLQEARGHIPEIS